MTKEKVNLLTLFKEKKYSKVIIIIEQIKNEDKTPALLNLSGVCRMMSSNSSETIRLAIDDFRNSYFKEIDKKKSKETIKNLINASVTFFDNEQIKNRNGLNNNFFEDINLIYKENQELFENDPNFNVIRLFDIEGNIINVNSWFECANYVYGGWSINYNAFSGDLFFFARFTKLEKALNGFLFFLIFSSGINFFCLGVCFEFSLASEKVNPFSLKPVKNPSSHVFWS